MLPGNIGRVGCRVARRHRQDSGPGGWREDFAAALTEIDWSVYQVIQNLFGLWKTKGKQEIFPTSESLRQHWIYVL